MTTGFKSLGAFGTRDPSAGQDPRALGVGTCMGERSLDTVDTESELGKG